MLGEARTKVFICSGRPISILVIVKGPLVPTQECPDAKPCGWITLRSCFVMEIGDVRLYVPSAAPGIVVLLARPPRSDSHICGFASDRRATNRAVSPWKSYLEQLPLNGTGPCRFLRPVERDRRPRRDRRMPVGIRIGAGIVDVHAKRFKASVCRVPRSKPAASALRARDVRRFIPFDSVGCQRPSATPAARRPRRSAAELEVPFTLL
jgi:hypothetical protein